jgi:23S rRNA (cytosine1962-C5)-methyltransferase
LKGSTVQIRKQKTESILRKHPWIFSGAIESDTSQIEDGEVVTATDNRGNFLAIGHFQHATIALRVLSFENVSIDQVFFQHRIENAVELRRKLGLFNNENTICRLIHGEGDSLPGLIIDYYNGCAVIQCHSIGMYRSIELISESLQKALKEDLKAVYSKSSDTLSQRSDIVDAYIYGNCETPHIAHEYGVKLNIDWINGQKTGFFVDQRENRALLGKYAKGKKILNTFCYSGGFSLSAIQNGATLVHSLDSSKKAIELTEQNVALNGYGDRHASILADAMEYMKDLQEDYDIIVLDPPAFAKHRDKRHKAIQGYKRLNAHAIRQIKPGGLIFTFSCSQVVDKYLFNNTVIAAAIEAGRNVRIIEQLHQPGDHPINAFHPEGEYLKGLVIEVE